MAKKVTLKDIADIAGVSIASVSMILSRSGVDNFNKETVEKVYAVAAQLGYTNKRGHNFSTGSIPNKLIKIIVPTLFNQHYTTIAQGIDNAAREHGFLTAVNATYWEPERERAYLEKANMDNVAGVVFTMLPQNRDLVYELNRRIPVVVVGDKRGDMELATVDMNNYNAGYILGQHLTELGHRRIAFISTSLDDRHMSRVRRCQGLKAACDEVGARLYIYQKNIIPDEEAADLEIEAKTGYALSTQCIAEHPDTTAMVAVNDVVGYGIYRLCKLNDFEVGKDLSICGIDNLFPSKFLCVDMTSVDSNLFECGDSAFKLIHEKMRNYEKHGTYISMTHIEFINTVQARKTTGPVREYENLKLKV